MQMMGQSISKRMRVAALVAMAFIVAFSLTVTPAAYASQLEAASIGSSGAQEAAPTLSTQALKAAAKTKNVAKQAFTTKTKKIQKKALSVKKGTTNLNFKKGYGYLKFKAPKTAKYSFKFSKLTGKNNVYSAFVAAQKQDKNSAQYSLLTNISTKGGSHDTLYLAEKGYKDKSGKTLYRHLTSRTGKTKLKKGEEIYFYFSSSFKNTHVMLKIS